ncbi:MAG: hypothetical protein CVU62_13880 [Deltaproteobacteria bacterium HGW-Deltaproteobacteria-2]|jgi:hypothetical protein|nr:MAG: hypothetical protein CVU62_13880 [Deltaproteobacteria bacterium HGW-Deltaproteobacteria-2]
MIVLNAGETLAAVLTSSITTNQPEFSTHFIDVLADDDLPGSDKGTLSGSTEITIVGVPSLILRMVKTVFIYNKDTVAAEVSVVIAEGTTSCTICRRTLAPKATLTIDDNGINVDT